MRLQYDCLLPERVFYNDDLNQLLILIVRVY